MSDRINRLERAIKLLVEEQEEMKGLKPIIEDYKKIKVEGDNAKLNEIEKRIKNLENAYAVRQTAKPKTVQKQPPAKSKDAQLHVANMSAIQGNILHDEALIEKEKIQNLLKEFNKSMQINDIRKGNMLYGEMLSTYQKISPKLSYHESALLYEKIKSAYDFLISVYNNQTGSRNTSFNAF